ncbi:unnamed protein product [Schistocephalus solidus]|uniref:Uncharacterized protein n=1 Tax=Schistocephalus solidus TaxID=70667 RepID=A0A183SAP5_SCHSO|nr:unnamed protein product [Schistocephalus solidus]
MKMTMPEEFMYHQQEPDQYALKPIFIRHDLNEKLESFFLEMVYRASNIYEEPADLCSAIRQCLCRRFGPKHMKLAGIHGMQFKLTSKGSVD